MNWTDFSNAKMTDKQTLSTLQAEASPGFTRFVVLCRSRTGSNMLYDMLHSHPEVRMLGEIFRKLDGRNLEDVLITAFQQKDRIRASGFKLFYYHPLDGAPDNLAEKLAMMKDLHVIHLKRRNILRTLLSRAIAAKTGIWKVSSAVTLDIAANRMITFSHEEVLQGFTQTRKWETNADKRFKDSHLLTVHYEELATLTGHTRARIADFLGLTTPLQGTTLIKQNPEPLSNLISNYAELKAGFLSSEWRSFFED